MTCRPCHGVGVGIESRTKWEKGNSTGQRGPQKAGWGASTKAADSGSGLSVTQLSSRSPDTLNVPGKQLELLSWTFSICPSGSHLENGSFWLVSADASKRLEAGSKRHWGGYARTPSTCPAPCLLPVPDLDSSCSSHEGFPSSGQP